MTNREQAAANFKALDAALIEHAFRGAPAPDEAALGYLHGWIIINGESFNRETATGEKYDPTQGGWAFL